MPADRHTPLRLARAAALLFVLAVAALARLWHLTAGVPHAVGIDEPLVVDRALRILRTGDWNPHIFNYPSLVIYVHAGVDILRFLWGALGGEWSSLAGFGVPAIYQADRLAAALVGVSAVWLTYKLGRELGSRPVALLAAAQMAVRPTHVRESHFVLTDVPMGALATLAMWMALRAARRGTIAAYAVAGAACGLSAAAKYTGGVVFVSVVAAWLLHERRSSDGALKLAAAAAAAAVAFLIGAPYTLLDLPSFLDGFASLVAQFSGPLQGGDPAWLVYAKHLWIDGQVAFVLALMAVPIVIVRSRPRAAWAPVLAMAAAYFYVLSSHRHVFGRYVLPLLPIVCLLSSVAVLELVAFAGRVPALARPAARRGLLAAATLVLIAPAVVSSIRWLDQYRRPDTRTIAADWLKKSAAKGARLAVENSGPTYLNGAGFEVIPTDLLIDHEALWYRARADYLVISAGDLGRYGGLLNAGPTVFEIGPTPQRWGPPIRIVKLGSS